VIGKNEAVGPARLSLDEMTPEQFEEHVEQNMRLVGMGLGDLQVTRGEKIVGLDGTYAVDVTARFSALGGSFLVLIECKRHKNPIKRELVQTLAQRIQSVGAHKGFMYATTRFQRGAIEFARKHGIALVQIGIGYERHYTNGPLVWPRIGFVGSVIRLKDRKVVDVPFEMGVLDEFHPELRRHILPDGFPQRRRI